MDDGSGLRDLGVALGLVLVLEGVMYALAPGLARRMAEEVRSIDEEALRKLGLGALFVGVAVVWWVRG
jgi:hypothetical protein